MSLRAVPLDTISPEYVAGIVDIEGIVSVLEQYLVVPVDQNGGAVVEAGGAAAKLQEQLDQQQQELDTLFQQPSIDEATVQRLMDKIERTQADFKRASGSSKRGSSVPSLQV